MWIVVLLSCSWFVILRVGELCMLLDLGLNVVLSIVILVFSNELLYVVVVSFIILVCWCMLMLFILCRNVNVWLVFSLLVWVMKVWMFLGK